MDFLPFILGLSQVTYCGQREINRSDTDDCCFKSLSFKTRERKEKKVTEFWSDLQLFSDNGFPIHRLKKKKNMIIPVNEDKAFDLIQYQFVIIFKNLRN